MQMYYIDNYFEMLTYPIKNIVALIQLTMLIALRLDEDTNFDSVTVCHYIKHVLVSDPSD